MKDFLITAKKKSYFNFQVFYPFRFGILMLFIVLNHNFSKEYDLIYKVVKQKRWGQ